MIKFIIPDLEERELTVLHASLQVFHSDLERSKVAMEESLREWPYDEQLLESQKHFREVEKAFKSLIDKIPKLPEDEHIPSTQEVSGIHKPDI